jgi:hypothetical protein
MALHRTNFGSAFTIASVERALDSHLMAGLIKGWERNGRKESGTRKSPLHIVSLHGGETVHLASLWESYALVSGLASARYVLDRTIPVDNRNSIE